MDFIFSPKGQETVQETQYIKTKKTIITDDYVLDIDSENMARNKEIFQKYQREANLGKSNIPEYLINRL